MFALIMTEQVPTYEQLKQENEKLKAQLLQQQQQQEQQEQQEQQSPPNNQEYPLSLDEYARYGRQMIVPQFGLKGILFKLSRSIIATNFLTFHILQGSYE